MSPRPRTVAAMAAFAAAAMAGLSHASLAAASATEAVMKSIKEFQGKMSGDNRRPSRRYKLSAGRLTSWRARHPHWSRVRGWMPHNGEREKARRVGWVSYPFKVTPRPEGSFEFVRAIFRRQERLQMKAVKKGLMPMAIGVMKAEKEGRRVRGIGRRLAVA